MLSEYKAQQSCERGFSFLKNPLFLADSVFLKSPERIEAVFYDNGVMFASLYSRTKGN
jgi:transposase